MSQKRRDSAVADRFGRNLRRVRRREGLSQEELAERASLHRTEVGKLEKGERVPRIDTLVRLADSMVVPPGELLDGIYWVTVPRAVGAFSFGSSSISQNPRPVTQEAGNRVKKSQPGKAIQPDQARVRSQ